MWCQGRAALLLVASGVILECLVLRCLGGAEGSSLPELAKVVPLWGQVGGAQALGSPVSVYLTIGTRTLVCSPKASDYKNVH